MKGILIKDAFMLLKDGKYLGIVALVYCILAPYAHNDVLLLLAMLFFGMMPITIMGLDERAKWDSYAAMLPYSRKEMVLSKYLLALMGIAVSALLYVAASLILRGLGIKGKSVMEMLQYVYQNLLIGIAYICLILPVVFKFGVEKGRLTYILLSAIFASMLTTVVLVLDQGGGFADLSKGSYLGLLGGLVLLLLAVSTALSVRIFEKRDL